MSMEKSRLEINEVERLMMSFCESGLAEMKLSLGEDKLVLRKYPETAQQAVIAPSAPAAYVPGVETATMQTGGVQASAAQAAEAAGQEGEGDPKFTEIKAPLAGVFYRAPEPDAAPFAEVGQEIKKGETVGLMEAMKVMSEIPSPVSGTIVSIEAADGEFAEYGAVLMKVR